MNSLNIVYLCWWWWLSALFQGTSCCRSQTYVTLPLCISQFASQGNLRADASHWSCAIIFLWLGSYADKFCRGEMRENYLCIDFPQTFPSCHAITFLVNSLSLRNNFYQGHFLKWMFFLLEVSHAIPLFLFLPSPPFIKYSWVSQIFALTCFLIGWQFVSFVHSDTMLSVLLSPVLGKW